MTPADLARKNAIPLEIKKDGLQQRQNGDWVLRFVVQAADMDERITMASMGTRFQAALVIIGDDELPITPAEKEPKTPSPKLDPATPQPAEPDRHSAGAKRDKRDWRDVPPTEQAGIRCEDAVFIKFLQEKYPDDWHESMSDPAECVRLICGVNTRKAFGTNQKARILWHSLDEFFIGWKYIDA